MTSKASDRQARVPPDAGTERTAAASGTYVGVARACARPRVLLAAQKGGAQEVHALLQRMGCSLERWTGRSGLARIAVHYALIVLALGLPTDDLGTCCDEIRQASPTTRVVLFAEREGVQSVLGAPAHELILSDEPPCVVEWRLRRAVRACTGSVLHWGPIAVDIESRAVTVSGKRCEPLTPTEFRLLVLLIERAGGLVSADEVVHLAMQVRAAANPRGHVSRLRKKLGPAGGLVETERGRGYFMRRA